MTDRPRLTIAEIERHQDEKGARKYPTPLADAGLSVGELLLHGVEESVDQRRYFMLAGVWTQADEDWYASLVARALPLADHPKPLPPDVPTAAAVAEHGPLWQLGRSVVEVVTRCGALCYREIGVGGSRPVEGAGPWLGPVVLRGGR